MDEHSLIASGSLWPEFNIKNIPVTVYDSVNTWLFFPDKAPEDFRKTDEKWTEEFPDYSRLAYDLSGSVWFINMDSGVSKGVTPECDSMINEIPALTYHCTAWSPDGKHLMVTRVHNCENGDQSYDVLAFDTENANSETIDPGRSLPKNSQIRNIDWSPEGDKIVLGTVSWVFEDHLMKNVIPDNQY